MISYDDDFIYLLLIIVNVNIDLVEGGKICVDLVLNVLVILLEESWVLVYDVVCFCVFY